jgi:hypothetical protein
MAWGLFSNGTGSSGLFILKDGSSTPFDRSRDLDPYAGRPEGHQLRGRFVHEQAKNRLARLVS